MNFEIHTKNRLVGSVNLIDGMQSMELLLGLSKQNELVEPVSFSINKVRVSTCGVHIDRRDFITKVIQTDG